MEEIDRAGEISGILKTLAEKPGLLHLDAKTATGVSLGEAIAPAQVADPEVIRSWNRAYSPVGGLAEASNAFGH